jgi:ABC-type nitrate/sulfonate/bicarbonate transport system substrate-binding protein
MTVDTIWYTRCPVPTAFSIAIQLGWIDQAFRRDGIALRSLATSSDREVRQSHFAHSQLNSLRHGGNIPPIVSRSRGSDVRIVGFSPTGSAKLVLALPQSGVRSTADLRGKRLSIPRRINDPIDFWGATVRLAFTVALTSAGLRWSDVVPIEVPIERSFVDDSTERSGATDTLWDAKFVLGHQREEILALLSGKVDAVFSHGSIAPLVKAIAGARTVLDLQSLGGREQRVLNDDPAVFTISGALIEERPDVVTRLVEVVQRAAEWARRNERDAKRIIAAETGLPEELVDQAYSPDVHEHLELNLDPHSLAALRLQHDHLLAAGVLTGPVDLGAFVDARPLEAAAPILAAE